LKPRPKIPEAKAEAKAEAEAEVTRPRPRPRPKFWPRGQFDLEALTSLSGSMNLRLQRRVLVQTVGHAQVMCQKQNRATQAVFTARWPRGSSFLIPTFTHWVRDEPPCEGCKRDWGG